jgi:magnesium transporter
MDQQLKSLDQRILPYIRKDFILLRQDMTVQQALDKIRQENPTEAIVYFYVADAAGRLSGVLPTRGLLTASPQQLLIEIMLTRVVALPDSASLLDACEFFVLYRLLALPVIDQERRLVGLIDVNLLTDEVLGFSEAEPVEDVFETIGLHLSQIRGVSPLKAFRFRFPWLLVTMSSGIVCAWIVSAYRWTLAKSVVVAFFLALVLALGESVSTQSATLTIQALHRARPTLRWFLRAFRNEVAVALLLGIACGAVALLIVWLWQGTIRGAAVVGSAVMCSLFAASVFGLTVPALLHVLKLDPKIAAGPITLALADVVAVAVYFTLAWLLL